MPLRRYTLVELYAGTARSAEAFRRWRRCRIGLLVDRDEFAADTYRVNYPRAPYMVSNIARLSGAEIERHAGSSVDILVGCPPCQGFSETGKRDANDRRNSHLTHFARLAAELRPRAVAMENVPAATERFRFKRFVDGMAELGYACTWGILNSALRGSAQCRHRLVFVGVRKDVRHQPHFPVPTHGGDARYFSYRDQRLVPLQRGYDSLLGYGPPVRRTRDLVPYEDVHLGAKPIPTIADVIGDLPMAGSEAGVELDHLPWQHTYAMRRRMARVPEGGRARAGVEHYAHAYGRLHRKGLCPTLTTFFSNPGSGRHWHPTEDRALSLREAARIQGFDDGFRFLPEAASCRLIGNALDSSLADVTYRMIRRALD